MPNPIIFSVIQSPMHPKLSDLYAKHNLDEIQIPSPRKAMQLLKKQTPRIICADFIYSYSSNYASNHICNLDSLLITLQKTSNASPYFIFFAEKSEIQHIDTLVTQYSDIVNDFSAFSYPIKKEEIDNLLRALHEPSLARQSSTSLCGSTFARRAKVSCYTSSLLQNS